MAKKTISSNQPEIYRIIWSNIRKCQYINNISDIQLAEMLEISPRTLYNYDNEPFKLTLEKVQLFLNYTQIKMEQLISI